MVSACSHRAKKKKWKISHPMGTGPKPVDPWKHGMKKIMIMAWLWNSITPEISETCIFWLLSRIVGMQFSKRMLKIEMRLKYKRSK